MIGNSVLFTEKTFCLIFLLCLIYKLITDLRHPFSFRSWASGSERFSKGIKNSFVVSVYLSKKTPQRLLHPKTYTLGLLEVLGGLVFWESYRCQPGVARLQRVDACGVSLVVYMGPRSKLIKRDNLLTFYYSR